MPKKTRKEKLLARYHKKLHSLENKHVESPIKNITEPKVIKPGNQYFFSELRKSLILITLIIGVEVALYYLKLIK